MKNKFLQLYTVLIACLLSTSLMQAQVCDPTKDLFPVYGQVNTGSTSKISNSNYQIGLTIGNTFIGSTRNPNSQTGSKGIELGFWTFMLKEPNTPVVTASDGDYEDHIEIKWDPLKDPIGPPITEQKLYRDNQFLGTFPVTQSAYIDFNVLPGHSYRYDVVTTNRFGNSQTGTDVGFVNPNGIMTGTVQTRSFIPVPDVEVVLQPTISYSAAFDGLNDKIVLTDSAINNLKAGTFEFWISPSKLTGSTIFSKQRAIPEAGHPGNLYSVISLGTYPDDNGNPVDGDPGRLYFHSKNGVANIPSKRTLSLNTWTHVTIVFDTTKAQIYINGMLDNELPGDYSIPDDRSPRDPRPVRTYAGYWEGIGNYFKGNLDEIRFWNQARSEEEIVANLNRTVSSDDSTLFLYWKFDEGKGTRAYDISGHFNHGLFCHQLVFDNVYKAPVYTSGITNARGNYIIKGINYGIGTTFVATPRKLTVVGRALEMDGVDDAVEVRKTVGDTAMSTGTFETWVYPRSVTGSQPIIALRNNGDATSSGVLSIENGKLQFRAKNNLLALDTTRIDTGYWYHVAVAFNQNNASFFINGERGVVVNGDYSIDTGVASTVATIGTFSLSHFYGRLDEVRIWNSERTQQQIQANMNAPFTTDQDGMEAYWKFNEGGGTSIADETSNLAVGVILNADTTIWTKRIPMNETFAHVYQPENRDVTLAPGNSVVDRIDFTDISLLTVTGFIKYIGTNCFADSAEVLVDGFPTAPQTYTGRDGKFIVEFEPGTTHRLTFKKSNHTFAPAFYEVRNITQPLVLKNPIFDTKTNTLTGVVGGGKCKLPIGVATVHVQSVNGCYDAEIQTDANGNYTLAGLPPLRYNVDVKHPNPTFTFDGEQVSIVDSGATLDFIYISPLRTALEFTPPTSCTGDTVFQQKHRYVVNIKIFEEYGAARCYMDSGTVRITDFITARITEHNFKNGLYSDTLFAQNVNIIPPYKLRYEVVATDPNTRQASANFSAIVTGTRARGNTYATTSPLRPIMILRDPPGDASNTFILKDSTYSSRGYGSFAHSEGFNGSVEVNLGPKEVTVVGIGVATEIEIDVKNSVTVSAGFEKTHDESSEWIQSMTFSSQYSTNVSDQFVGQGGDVYIGYASLIKYGVGDRLQIDTSTCSYNLQPTIVVNGDSVEAMYYYSENYLKQTEIPRLESLSTNMTIDSTQRSYFARQALAWRRWVDLNTEQKANATFKENVTWDAGAIIDKSVQTSKDSTWEWQDDWEINEEVMFQLGFAVKKIGVQTTFGSSFGQSIVNGGSKTINSTKTWGYHLEDDDAGDLHGVAIYVADDGGPVFKLIGGETACPWEEGTLNREGVQLQVAPSTAINVPPDEPAVFTLACGNLSATNEDATYQLRILPESNPDGAVIAVNGIIIENFLNVFIPAGSQVPLTMTVSRGPLKYNYPDLKMMLVSECERDWAEGGGSLREQFVDTVSFSVNFEVPCSEIKMASPTNHWLITASDPDSVYITLNGYDKSNPDFKDIRFQYRVVSEASNMMAALKDENTLIVNPSLYQPVGTPIKPADQKIVLKDGTIKGIFDNPWINALVVPKDSLPSDQNYMTFIWKVTPDIVFDGKYEIRAISTCFSQTINGSSGLISGRIDRQPPQLLGSTEPVDGVLGQDDQIIAHFNETIDCNALHPQLNVHLTNSSTGLEIDKTITCNGQTVVVTPNIQNRFIENQVLRLSFTDDGSAPAYGVRDVYGNRIQHALEYEFYVDKNSMRWNDPTFQTIANQGQTLTFTRRIINSGTFAQSYTMSGIPSWLTVSPVNAVIPAGFSQDVSFSISPQLSGGFYKDTIFASTANGEEDLVLDFRLLCQSPNWQPAVGTYPYDMSILATLTIDGVESKDIYDRVGVFVGNEPRGMADLTYNADANKYFMFLTIYSNVTSGEPLIFKVWDASSCRELGVIQETYTFKADTVIGRPDHPASITTTSQVVQRIPLQQGWSWFSLNLKSSDMSLGSVLSNVNLSTGDIIRSQVSFSQAVPSFGWVGTLSSFNNKSMYQSKLSTIDTIEFTGYPVSLPDTIPVAQGWNWVAYQPQTGMSPNIALASMNALNGDLVKNQYAFSVFLAPQGWIGSLNFMSPNLGYKIKSGAPTRIIYPASNSTMMLAKSDIPTQASIQPPQGWSLNPFDYQYTMSLIGEVKGIEAVDSLDAIGAFVNGECRGFTTPVYVSSLRKHLFFLMMYSNNTSGEQVEFRYFSHNSGKEYAINGNTNFQTDAVLGDVQSPYDLLVNPNGIVSENGLPTEFNLSQNYPNPFNPSTTISYAVPIDANVEIVIYDLLGQQIRTLVRDNLQAGFYNVTWDGTNDAGHHITTGMYFYKMTAGNYTSTRKLLLLK